MRDEIMSEYKTFDDIMADAELVELLGLNEPVHKMFTPKFVTFNKGKARSNEAVLNEAADILSSGIDAL